MNRIILTFALLLAAGAGELFASIVLHGRVTDHENEPLPAIVTVLSGTAIKGYGYADDEGRYTVSFEATSDSVLVKVSLIGFDAIERKVAAKPQTLDFVMNEGGFVLREVSVVADKITQRGDTISYRVGAYQSENDRVIGDVIKKMPGLEVSESGQISFNGKTVKNFYIEDMDLLEGRYGIATNNISANDVASVQVYQNHQPVRALKDWIPSEDVTINLKLKSSARGAYTLNGMAGGGYKPAMWAAEAVAMYFGKRWQSITAYKGNNSADNITAELNSKTNAGEMSFFNNAPLSVISAASPGLSGKRYMHNRTNTVSTNNILSIDTLSTLSLSVAYIDDILSGEGMTTTDQYMPDGAYRNITQRITTKDYAHTLTGSSTFKKNTDALYAENSLRVNAGWNRSNGVSLTTASFMDNSETVRQSLDNPSFTISDKANVIITSDDNIWDLNFGAGLNHKPQALVVSPATIFADADRLDQVEQRYTTDDLRAEAQTGAHHKAGKFVIDGFVFGNIDIERVATDLDGFSPAAMPMLKNDYTFGKGNLGAEAAISYINNESMNVTLTLPLAYNVQWLRDRLDTGRDRNWNYINLTPSLKIGYTFGRKGWMALNLSFFRMRDNSGRVAPGIVMTDYLSFREYLVDKTMVDKTYYNTFEYHYSNALIQLFGNVSLSWLRSWHNTMTGYDYDGLVTVRNVYDIANKSDNFQANAGINKGLGFWESTLKIGAVYSLRTSQQLIDARPVDYTAQYWSSNLLLAVTPADWMGGALGFAYGESRSHTVVNASAAPTVRHYTGRLDLNFFPIRRLVVNVAVEDNYTNMTAIARHAWFGDIKLTYKMRRFDWELELNNVFNRREFTRVTYSDMNIYRSVTRLRERNVMLKLRYSLR